VARGLYTETHHHVTDELTCDDDSSHSLQLLLIIIAIKYLLGAAADVTTYSAQRLSDLSRVSHTHTLSKPMYR